MGWAARLNPRTREPLKTQYLREFCERMPRMVIMDTLPKMRERDRLIVLKMLDEVQPEIAQ